MNARDPPGDPGLGPQGRGHYQMHGEIARGGMRVIVKAHDADLGRDVALKVLREDLAKRPEVVRRFMEEAQIAGQLQHPGIVPVYELGLMADQRPYFAMKLVKGRTLAALLSEHEASTRRKLLDVFEAVCQTMAYAHSKGVIHRDLKPANILIGAFGEVQVVDWGLAKVLHRGGPDDEKQARPSLASSTTAIEMTRNAPGSTGPPSLAGSVMGTPAYMPPEQARGDVDKLDERSDVFSLGAILCEILTGAPPYSGGPETVLDDALNARLEGAHRRLQQCSADRELVELTTQCLTPAQWSRPRSAELLAERIHAYLVSVEERAHAAQIHAAEATLHRGQKNWKEARASVEHALALLETGEPTSELRRRVKSHASLVATESAAADRQAALERQHHELLALLSELTTPGVGPPDLTSVDEAIHDAFSAHGLEIDDLSVDEAVAALDERAIGVAVAEMLDRWAVLRTALGKGDDADHLMQIAERADADPTRRRLRAAIRSGDHGLLKSVALERQDLGKLPADSLCLLAEGLDAITLDEAVQSYTAALALEPDHARLLANLGRWFVEPLGDPTRGLALLERAVELDPRDAWIRRRLGFALCNVGEFERAIPEFVEAARLQPKSPRARECVGVGLLWQGDFEQAIAVLREALTLDPADEETRHYLTVALLESGDVDGAEREREEVKRRGAQQIFAAWDSAFIRAAAHDLLGARSAFDHATSRTNQNGLESMCALSVGLADFPEPRLRDPARALDCARRAVEISPRSTFAWDALGRALYRSGDWSGAIDAMERSMKWAAGGSAFQRFVLAMAWQQQGRPVKAQELYRDAVEWMEKRHGRNADLMRSRAEAESVLGIGTDAAEKER